MNNDIMKKASKLRNKEKAKNEHEQTRKARVFYRYHYRLCISYISDSTQFFDFERRNEMF